MTSNSFGTYFRITTWGESHGPAIGVVIDGCPAGIPIDEANIQQALSKRAPGRNNHTSPRKESDQMQILSGVFEGKSTGAPISIMIPNKDASSSHYEPIKHLIRPGHANYTYLKKYGCFDYRGGGRASARETACRVAAAAIAEELLKAEGITSSAFLYRITGCNKKPFDLHTPHLWKTISGSPVFCPDSKTEENIIAAITKAKKTGDSLGGIVVFQATGLPVGLGDPVYHKLEAKLAQAMLSIPASKGFSIGDGFDAADMKGSEHNDALSENPDNPFLSNHAGGTLGGISSGQMLWGRVAFKPTSSIKQSQQTITTDGQSAEFKLPEGSRHDPCVAIRAVPVVKAMLSLTLADLVLANRLSTISKP